MSNVMSIALTGLGTFRKKLEVSANNTVNANTDGFKKSRVDMTAAYPDGVKVTISRVDTPGALVHADGSDTAMKESSNVSLEEETVTQLTAKQLFETNIKVVQTEDEMTGTLLDIKA
ncbi:MAG: hypothetical protein CSYNP_00162 [Syntrophus sp. SKADARSKE-3]|nr:hypothetical protein [Syntrophus sp. SKADARSKE-3]